MGAVSSNRGLVMVIITLATDEEANALRQLIDLAVRGHGLKVAQAGLFFDAKIAKAMEAAAATPPPPEQPQTGS